MLPSNHPVRNNEMGCFFSTAAYENIVWNNEEIAGGAIL